MPMLFILLPLLVFMVVMAIVTPDYYLFIPAVALTAIIVYFWRKMAKEQDERGA